MRSRKRYFIKKVVFAKDVKEALRIEKSVEASEIYEDYNWQEPKKVDSIGFK